MSENFHVAMVGVVDDVGEEDEMVMRVMVRIV